MRPVKIKIFEKTKLFIIWDDDSESKIDIKYLRDECPCASCKGETVLLKTYRPAKPTAEHPESYKIKDILPVGEYAIQIVWKDGHDSGLYTWDYLKELDKSQGEGGKQHYKKII
jgi:DUF971 family protein